MKKEAMNTKERAFACQINNTKKTNLLVTKHEFIINEKEYELYLIPETDCTSIYIGRKGYGDLYYTIGLNPENVSEEIILANLLDWVDIADENTIE